MKVFVEGQAWHVIEKRGDHDEGNGVAEGEPPVAAVAAEDLLGFSSDAIAVLHNTEMRLDLVEKGQGRSKALPLTQERCRLADYIPGCGENHPGRGGVQDKSAGRLVIGVSRIEAGVKKRGITEKTGRQSHYRGS